ncbi:MAG: hypothetical protein LR011_06970 [Verrucomicrobia bacterium]|nr:hypothetical protein [Verrucomicrobiota bacterium]
MAKFEVSWKRSDEDGVKWQVYSCKEGDGWAFFQRERRFDNWERVENPGLGDWMELLDGIDRRANRRLCKPEEARKLRAQILKMFPGTELPPPIR